MTRLDRKLSSRKNRKKDGAFASTRAQQQQQLLIKSALVASLSPCVHQSTEQHNTTVQQAILHSTILLIEPESALFVLA